MTMYRVPNEFFTRLHHSRPRFKTNIEDVLLFVAGEITLIGKKEAVDFSTELHKAITLFPGNSSKSTKTIDNWRTEIISLLGLVEFTDDGCCKPSALSRILASNQDLIEFFRFFCFKFQYPGGHVKPQSTVELIKRKVKFKPVKYLLKVLLEGNKANNGRFGITKAEATHCIFNDLRVTRDNREPKDTLNLIQSNRDNNIKYNSSGDIVRYAGDILDYMELANLATLKADYKFYAKTHEVEVLDAFIQDNSFFPEYEELYKKEPSSLTSSDVRKTQNKWFSFVNANLDSNTFSSNILDVLEEDSETANQENSAFIKSLLLSIANRQKTNAEIKSNEIGNVGESIAIRHEQLRLKHLDRPELAKKVIKMPEILSAGYDINSFEGLSGIKRCIEVKTTISKNRTTISRFHMTPNEWGAAETFKEAYFIYRLMVSSNDVRLFIINDPVGKYKSDDLSMTPRDGVNITYNNNSGQYEALLT